METRLNNHAKNRILADLTSAEYQRIFPHLETVDLSSGKIIYDLDQPIDYLYFPLGSMISLVTQMEDGKIVEVGLVGNDGMSGISALLGQKTSPDRAFVQIPNGAVRIKLEVILQSRQTVCGLKVSSIVRAHRARSPLHLIDTKPPDCRMCKHCLRISQGKD